MNEFGVMADATIGHSLGEITALHWGKCLTRKRCYASRAVRGAAMTELGSPTGAMLAVAAPWPTVQAILNGDALTIVGYNSPRQTVVAGDATAINNSPGSPPRKAGRRACCRCRTHFTRRSSPPPCRCWPDNSRAKNFRAQNATFFPP